MQQIPIQPVPAQTLKTVLDGQNCQIAIYQKTQGLFFDLSVDGARIVAGVICLDAVPLVCVQYVGFVGNFMFIDTQGTEDPEYSGLNSRFQLIYLTGEEYALISE
jgi:hypothetical protein